MFKADIEIVFNLPMIPNEAIRPPVNNVIAANDFSNFVSSIKDNTNIEAANIAIDTAILFKASAFNLLWNACNDSPTPSNISVNASVISLTLPNMFLIPLNIPNKRPALSRSIIVFSPVPSNAENNAFPTDANTSAIFPNIVLTRVHKVFRNPINPSNPEVSILSLATLKKFLNVSIIFWKTPATLSPNSSILLDILTVSLKPTKKSPRPAVTDKIPPPRPLKHPNTLTTALTTDLNIDHTISTAANKPLKVRLSLSAFLSVIDNFLVNFSKLSNTLYNCSEVVFGNISLKACLIGLTILSKAFQAFDSDLMINSLPDNLFIFST